VVFLSAVWRAARLASAVLPLGVWLSGCSSSGDGPASGRASPSAGSPLTILYTADAQGYLEECACETGGMLGGIARRAALVDSLRAREPGALLLEAGDFATGPGPYGEMVGLVAARAMARMKYDAVLPGEVELNLEPDFWQKVAGLELPFVHTNFGGPGLGPPQREALILERDGRRIAVLGLLGTDLYFMPERRAEPGILDPVEAAGAALEKLRDEDVDLVVALVHMKGPAIDSLAARRPEIDVLVAGHTAKNLEKAERRGSALLVSAGFLGQHLGALSLSGPGLEEARNSVIRLEPSLPEDPEIARWAGIAARK
jgi:2',3'-cyclic-nucleotide 2'-phosphodiesterase (5'-nucleotidase family)